MKIMGSYYTPPMAEILKKNKVSEKNKPENQQVSFKSLSQPLDSITISSTQKSADNADEQFVSSLKAQISREMSIPASQEKLDALAAQISKGEYEINAGDIAKKIMLIGVVDK